jgi:hypothetical protein
MWRHFDIHTDLPIHPPDSYALMDAYLCREALDAAMSAATPAGKGMPLHVQPKTVGHLLRKNNLEKALKLSPPSADKQFGTFTNIPAVPADARQPM